MKDVSSASASVHVSAGAMKEVSASVSASVSVHVSAGAMKVVTMYDVSASVSVPVSAGATKDFYVSVSVSVPVSAGALMDEVCGLVTADVKVHLEFASRVGGLMRWATHQCLKLGSYFAVQEVWLG